MSEWFDFALYALQKLVETVFSLDLGMGFSLGDFDVALLLIGLVATALVVKTGSFLSGELDGGRRIHDAKITKQSNMDRKYGVFPD